jgi:hypothetical protein
VTRLIGLDLTRPEQADPKHAALIASTLSNSKSGVSIHGLVRAKSALKDLKSAGKAFFLVELTCSDRRFIPGSTGPVITAFIFFTQDAQSEILSYYHSIQVNNCYMFTNLSPKLIQTSKNATRKLLLFSPVDSKLFKLSFKAVREKEQEYIRLKKDSLNLSSNPFSDFDSDHDHPSSLNSPFSSGLSHLSHLVSYCGRITKVIDVNAGVFELDDRHHLYLTYYPLLDRGMGMRVGVKLK